MKTMDEPCFLSQGDTKVIFFPRLEVTQKFRIVQLYKEVQDMIELVIHPALVYTVYDLKSLKSQESSAL